MMSTNIRTRDNGREHIREMLIGDQAVCWLTVIDYTMRIGGAAVRMAGLGNVETRREHRKKGYMRVLLGDTVPYMQQEGYDVSMLFGIPDFYYRFGYATCLPIYRATIQTRDAERAAAGAQPLTSHPIGAPDLPDVIDLYNRNNALRSGSLIRSAEYFKGFTQGTLWNTPPEGIAFQDVQGRFAGYAAWDGSANVVNVLEVEAVDAAYYPALLGEFARLAMARRCGHITLLMPPDHPFGQFAQAFGLEWSVRYPRQSDGMGRILNQSTLFEKLRPELARRAAESPLRGRAASLSLRTELGETSLALGAANAPAQGVVKLSQDRLLQLVMGYCGARELLADSEVRTEQAQPDLARWLDALFPRGYPHTWQQDNF